MKLHNYFRSSASFRVRIALEIKGLSYDYLPVHLARGEQRKEAYAALVPDRLVPMLEIDGLRLSQSMTIIEYLDETRPSPPCCRPMPLAAPACAPWPSRSPAKSIRSTTCGCCNT